MSFWKGKSLKDFFKGRSLKSVLTGEGEGRFAILKRLLALLVVILLIFGIINAVWFFGYKQRYNAIAAGMEQGYLLGDEDTGEIRYSKEVDNHTITLKMPAYLGEGGFITIGNSEGYVAQTDVNGNVISDNGMYISLYIWPRYFSGYRIGLDFTQETRDIWYQVEFNQQMEMTDTDELDDAYIEEINGLMDENREEIDTLIRIARESLGVEIRTS